MKGVKQIMPDQHRGKEGQKITTIMIINAEIGETRRISGNLIHKFRSSSPVKEMRGQTQTRDLTADREVICRTRKTRAGTLRWAPGVQLINVDPEDGLIQSETSRASNGK